MSKFIKVAGIGCAVLLVLVVGIVVVAYNMVDDELAYETSFEVDRPVDVAWAVFSDEERMTEWMPGLIRMDLMEGEYETVGSKYRLVFDENGQTMEMIETITAIEPEEEFAFSFTMEEALMEGEIRVLFEGQGERTTIRTENVVRGKSLMKIFVPLMREQMVARQELGYRQLADMIEAETGAATEAPAGD